MKTIKKVPITFKKVVVIPEVSKMEERVIYISDEFDVASHRCLCGCGEETVTPIDQTMWKYCIDDNKLTMRPSIGNYQFECRSHYIIQKSIANFV